MEKPEEQIESVTATDEDVISPEESAAFESGFSGATETPTETTPPAAQTTETPEPVVAAPVASAMVQVTEAQYNDLLAKVNTVDDLKGSIEKLRGDAFGKVGGLERTLKQIQEATPVGQAIEVKAEDLAELEKEFPGLNLGPSLAKDLTRVLSKFKGTGAVTPGLTPEQITAQFETERARIATQFEEERKQRVAERVGDRHEDWREVIGAPDSQTEFRTWLKGLGAEKEQEFLSSWDPRLITTTLTTFKERKKTPETPKPSTTTRTQRLAEAVPAKGGGIPPVKSKKSEEEAAFEEGFATSRS